MTSIFSGFEAYQSFTHINVILSSRPQVGVSKDVGRV
jgi:hypothetical protein